MVPSGLWLLHFGFVSGRTWQYWCTHEKLSGVWWHERNCNPMWCEGYAAVASKVA